MATPVRSRLVVAGLTVVSLLCFAANSLLARAALGGGHADAATFTAVRLASGAAALVALALARGGRRGHGSWRSALALLAYAAPFSFAYLRIPAGTGAFLLFAAVQVTMIGAAIAAGARPSVRQWLGLAVAIAGLAALARPGAGGADPLGALLMLLAGAAWGIYSLRGRAAADPLATTADNFVRATGLAVPIALGALLAGGVGANPTGLGLAVAAGALASGGGYTLWYAAVPALGATRAAVVQLAVPPLAAAGAVGLLGEPLTARVAVSGAAILVGIGLTVGRR